MQLDRPLRTRRATLSAVRAGQHEEKSTVDVATTRPAIPSGLLAGGVVAIGRHIAADDGPRDRARPSPRAASVPSS